MHKASLKDTLVGTYHDAEEKVEDFLYDKWHIRLHKRVKHHVHKLRKRPDHHKDFISFFIAFVVTLIVFTGWYFVSFPRLLAQYELNKKENAVLNKASPIEELKQRTNIETQ